MLVAIAGIGLTGGGTSRTATIVALGISTLWAAASGLYLLWNSRTLGRPILPSVPSAKTG